MRVRDKGSFNQLTSVIVDRNVAVVVVAIVLILLSQLLLISYPCLLSFQMDYLKNHLKFISVARFLVASDVSVLETLIHCCLVICFPADSDPSHDMEQALGAKPSAYRNPRSRCQPISAFLYLFSVPVIRWLTKLLSFLLVPHTSFQQGKQRLQFDIGSVHFVWDPVVGLSVRQWKLTGAC